MKALLRFTVRLFSVGFLLAILAVAGVIGGIWDYGRDLPDYRALADYEQAPEKLASPDLQVAADICVFTNGNLTVETVG